jgi:hypothetical protein
MKEGSPFIRFRQGISRDLQRGAYRLGVAGPRVLQWLSDPRGVKTGLLLVGAGLLGGMIILGIIYAPPWLVASWRGQVELKDLAKLESDARTAVIQALGGTALLIGLFFTWRSIRATERNLQITQQTAVKNLVVAVDGHLTERFTRAIEHLGSDQLVVRLGAIYTLEQIAWPPARDHSPVSIGNRWPIMEILNAYVRAHTPWPPTASEPATGLLPKPAPDIQAILTVLGRRSKPYGSPLAYLGMGGQPPDLRSTDLRGADLTDARFEEALLQEAHLEHANLLAAHLEKAELTQAHLEGADLSSAYLQEAHLFGAYLNQAKLSETHFEGAHLQVAHLEEQFFFKTHLEGANLFGAYLQRATFRGTHLKGASLFGTHLEGARELTVEQLAEVKTLREAHLDPSLQEQVQQQYPHLLEEPQNPARIP